MKIEIVLDNSEKVVLYGVTPLEFARAVVAAHEAGRFEFQTKAIIEEAVCSYNERKLIS